MAKRSTPGAKPPESAAGQPGSGSAQHDPLASQFGEATADDWRRLLHRKESGGLVDCWQNVYLYLANCPEWKGVIWLDEFTNRVVRRIGCPIGDAGEWQPEDELKLGMWLSQRGQHDKLLVRAQDTITRGVSLIARETRFHPVREWLQKLSWDGTPRLATWLSDCLDVKNNAYTQLVGNYWLIAMVARVMRPGCDFKYMPVLCGVQDAGKSRAMKALGGEWFADTPFDMRDKDSMQVLRGKWLYEMTEMDAFNRAESARAKAFVGSPADNYRASYDSTNRDWPRQVVFVGTSNPVDLFKDPTGNVRYWPLEVGDEVNVDLVGSMREQLFGEAYKEWMGSARFVPTREQSRDLFAPMQEEHEQRDPWVDLVADYALLNNTTTITTIETLSKALGVEKGKQTDQMARRVGMVMRKLGWTRKRDTSGARGYYYVKPAPPPISKAGGPDDPPF